MDSARTGRTLRTAGIGLAAAGLVFGARWPLWTAAALLCLSLCRCRASESAALALERGAGAAARAVTLAVLALVYFLAVTPSALLYRLFNRRALARFTSDPGDSLFEEPGDGGYGRETFEKPW